MTEELLDKLEPEAKLINPEWMSQNVDMRRAVVSIAASLKRIADTLDDRVPGRKY